MPKSSFTTKGPTYYLPPRIIGGSVKVFGRSIMEILGVLLATLVALFYMLIIPFPDLFNVRLVIALFLFIAILSYMLVPLAGMTGLEWTLALLRYKNSHIPKKTRARPSPAGRYVSRTSLTTTLTTPARPRRIDLTRAGISAGASILTASAPELEVTEEEIEEIESKQAFDDPSY